MGLASAKVDVSVRSDGKTVEVLQRRPVRRLPNGNAGVVYGGEVFPLYAGNVIDLADKPFHKADCYDFVSPNGPIPYTAASADTSRSGLQVGRWNIEHNRFGNYLVFDSDEDTAEQVAMLIEEVGLGVIRWDASSRPAEDGYHYDWFIRLEFRGSGNDAHARVADALASVSAEEAAQTDIARPEPPVHTGETQYSSDDHTRLMGIIDGLFASVEEWRAAHGDVAARVVQLEQNLSEALKARRQKEQETLDEQRRRLETEAELASSRAIQQAARSDQDELGEAVRRVKERAETRIKQAHEDRLNAEKYWEEAEDQASRQKERVIQLESRLTSTDAALADLTKQKQALESHISELSSAEDERSKRQAAGRARKTSSGRTSADRFVEQVLPRLILSPEGLDTLAAMKDPSRVFNELYALNNKETPPSVPFKGASARGSRIMEVKRHLHIGDEGKSSDMGRVYYCLTDNRVFVHVHRKQNDNEQQQTVRRFASWCGDQLSD